MKGQLKSEEIKLVNSFIIHHPSAKMIRHYREWQHLKENDVLIRDRMDGTLDKVSEQCDVPKKFKVIHIDELGFPWVKNINVRGGLGTKLYNLSESLTFTYKIDTEQLDCLLLGGKYDPRAQYREWRKRNPTYGGS